MPRHRRRSLALRSGSPVVAALSLLLLTTASCGSNGEMGTWNPTDASQCMSRRNAVVISSSTVGDEQTIKFRLPSGARVEATFIEPANNAVQVVKWLTADPTPADRSMVEACFPTE
jgi:hypothetical protein